MDKNVKLIVKRSKQKTVARLNNPKKRELNLRFLKNLVPSYKTLFLTLMALSAVIYFYKYLDDSSNNYIVGITKGIIYPKRFIAASTTVQYDK